MKAGQREAWAHLANEWSEVVPFGSLQVLVRMADETVTIEVESIKLQSGPILFLGPGIFAEDSGWNFRASKVDGTLGLQLLKFVAL